MDIRVVPNTINAIRCQRLATRTIALTGHRRFVLVLIHLRSQAHGKYKQRYKDAFVIIECQRLGILISLLGTGNN